MKIQLCVVKHHLASKQTNSVNLTTTDLETPIFKKEIVSCKEGL